LDEGRFGDSEIVPRDALREMRTPVVFTDDQRLRFPEFLQRSYGLGLGISAYRGHELDQHFGAVYGFTAHMALLPAEHAAIVGLTNADPNAGGPFLLAVDLWVLDRLLGVTPAPWRSRMLERGVAPRSGPPALPDAPPSRPLGDYAGAYEHPGYGELAVDLRGDTLVMTYNRAATPLRHVSGDVFEATVDPFRGLRFTFSKGSKGAISDVSVPLSPAPPTFSRRVR
jgi:hypothetical protein